MAYHYFSILIHRPWTSKSSQPQGNVGPGHKHARQICCTSAAEIASLLRSYESCYGFRKMNVYGVTIIFSAALILIFALVSDDKAATYSQDKSTIIGDLNTCFRALDELGQSYDTAKRIRESLLAIQKHWTTAKRDAMKGNKRRSQLHLSAGTSAPKRPRSAR